MSDVLKERAKAFGVRRAETFLNLGDTTQGFYDLDEDLQDQDRNFLFEILGHKVDPADAEQNDELIEVAENAYYERFEEAAAA